MGDKLKAARKGALALMSKVKLPPGHMGMDKQQETLPQTGNEQAPSDYMQDAKDFTRGAGQGLTFGFSDELVGGAKAGWDKLTGEEQPISELYKKYQQEEQMANEKSEERSPWLYNAGEIAGSVPSMMGTGGAAGAANVISKANKVDKFGRVYRALSKAEAIQELINKTAKIPENMEKLRQLSQIINGKVTVK